MFLGDQKQKSAFQRPSKDLKNKLLREPSFNQGRRKSDTRLKTRVLGTSLISSRRLQVEKVAYSCPRVIT